MYDGVANGADELACGTKGCEGILPLSSEASTEKEIGDSDREDAVDDVDSRGPAPPVPAALACEGTLRNVGCGSSLMSTDSTLTRLVAEESALGLVMTMAAALALWSSARPIRVSVDCMVATVGANSEATEDARDDVRILKKGCSLANGG